MQSIINTYQFDHKTGLPRGQQGPGLYAIETGTSGEDQEEGDIKDAEANRNTSIGKTNIADNKASKEGDSELYAIPRGGPTAKVQKVVRKVMVSAGIVVSVCVWACAHGCIHTSTSTYTSIYLSLYLSIYTCTNIYIYIYTRLYTYIHTHTYIYIYTYIHTHSC